jgi:hypothetical protein
MTELKPHYKQGDTPNPVAPLNPSKMGKPDTTAQVRREHAALDCLYLLSHLIRNSDNAMLNGVLTDMQVGLEDLTDPRKKWALRELHVIHISDLVTEEITTLPPPAAEDLVLLCQHYCTMTNWTAAVTPEIQVMINTYASNVGISTLDDIKDRLCKK